MMQAAWYFDFISPFAYLQSHQLKDIEKHYDLTPVPILFAGLLKHYGHLGPAEIPSKRKFTYQQIVWRAHQSGIALKFPAGHPFNPLPLLRMCIALDNHPEVIRRLFDFVWRDGYTPDSRQAFQNLQVELGIQPEQITTQPIKQALAQNTTSAIEAGVFGVPTLATQNQLFWGDDATTMAIGYANRDSAFELKQMQRVENLPELRSRPR